MKRMMLFTSLLMIEFSLFSQISFVDYFFWNKINKKKTKNTVIGSILAVEKNNFYLAENKNGHINYNLAVQIKNNIKKNYPSIIKDIENINTTKNKHNAKVILRIIGNEISNYKIKYKEQSYLTDALKYCKSDKCYYFDCDMFSFLYFYIGKELGLPLVIVHGKGHAFIRWKFNANDYINWETTDSWSPEDSHYKKILRSRYLHEVDNLDKVLSLIYLNSAADANRYFDTKLEASYLEKAYLLDSDNIIILKQLVNVFLENNPNKAKFYINKILQKEKENVEYEYYKIYNILIYIESNYLKKKSFYEKAIDNYKLLQGEDLVDIIADSDARYKLKFYYLDCEIESKLSFVNYKEEDFLSCKKVRKSELAKQSILLNKINNILSSDEYNQLKKLSEENFVIYKTLLINKKLILTSLETDYENAVAWLLKQKIKEIEDYLLYWYNGLAYLEIKNKNYTEAIVVLNKALDLSIFDKKEKEYQMKGFVYNNMAWAKYNKCKKINDISKENCLLDALVDVNKSIEINSNNPFAYNTRACIKLDLSVLNNKQYFDFKKDFQESLSMLNKQSFWAYSYFVLKLDIEKKLNNIDNEIAEFK